MLDLFDAVVDGRRVRVAATERHDGDLHPERVEPRALAARQRALTGTTWSMADQIHGIAVWRVPDGRRGAVIGPAADVVVAGPGADAPAVWSADCATVMLVCDDAHLVAVHAGWRGLATGVIDVAVDAACSNGRSVVAVVAGPMIGVCCYEFGEADLRSVAAGVGADADSVRGTTTEGAPGLSTGAAVRAALARRGLRTDAAAPGCTGCSDRWWSHRVGVDNERQALVGWWP